MTKLISNCPACQSTMYASSLQCRQCGMELRNEFALSNFDLLNEDQLNFLLSFLRHRGNLKNLQKDLQLSYPAAKKRLDELLTALDLQEQTESKAMEVINVNTWNTNPNSVKASEIIRHRLKENGGHIVVHTLQDLPAEIWADPDGISFRSDKLPIKPPYTYDVFDIIVDLLVENNCRARKGNGRNFKLGQPGCEENTVVGAVAARYSGKKPGESVFDPVFVLSAVLEWAGIVHNERGELILTQAYRSML